MTAAILDKLYFGLALAGLHLGAGLVLWQIITPSLTQATASAAINAQKPLVLQKTVTSGQPIRLVIPAIGMDLPISIGQYDAVSTKWTQAKDKAFFAAVSTPPNNDRGNSLIYGHNNKAVFRPLIKQPLAANTEMMVYSDNGHIFHYKFTGSYEVNPSDTSVFSYDGPAQLTLQTCVGDWNEHRKMFTFDFMRVQKHVQ